MRCGYGLAGAKIDEARKGLSFYELLGIPEKGTLLELTQAYKQLARKCHPDVSPPDRIEEYEERFIRVQEAYETLSDPRRRALYDKNLAFGLHLAFYARRRYQYDEIGKLKTDGQVLKFT
ncbi:Chaperone protein dnaJ 20 [Hibiscus syriacus]|uniref:Chaperone protein dnaJ 20 n=1 Tax=Hibiscus syriacus TaxID=106335 RepID=A0A6A2Y279_HIBSY|nr:Chaperone protein dnaJ 20 [Hibiscus syriacus]